MDNHSGNIQKDYQIQLHLIIKMSFIRFLFSHIPLFLQEY